MPPARPDRIDALTSLRGLAAWWVALYHFREILPLAWDNPLGWFLGRGPYAVDLFFVLSGFVLQINYAPSLARLNVPALRKFAAARFARVYPLHFVMMIAWLAIPMAILLFSRHGLLDGRFDLTYYVLSLLLIQNWGFVDYMGWNVPAWSISTEFAAYILFPLLAPAVMRLRHWSLAAATACVIAAALALLFWSAGRGNLLADIPVWGLPRCLGQFAIGAAIGRIYQLRGAPGGVLHALLLAFAGVCFWFAFTWRVSDYFILPAGFAALVFALTARLGPLTRALNWPPLVYLGEISYATYMVHFFLRELIKFGLRPDTEPSLLLAVLFVIPTFAASVVLYHLVERPARGILRDLGSTAKLWRDRTALRLPTRVEEDRAP